MVGPYSAPSNANDVALLLVSVTGSSSAPTILSQLHLQRPPPKSCYRYVQIFSAPALCTVVAGWSMTATNIHFNLDKIACKLSAKLVHQAKHLRRRGAASKRCACRLRRLCLYATKSKVSHHTSAHGNKAILRHYLARLTQRVFA